MSRLTRSFVPESQSTLVAEGLPRDGVAELTARMARSWRHGERLPTEAFLNERPELWDSPEEAFELVYEELCLRQELAEPATLNELRRRFPQWEEQLALLFRCHRLLAPDEEQSLFPIPGQTIGEFQLVAELGRGAHGRVFLARQRSLGGREVALKISTRPNGEHLCLALMQHTNIVPLYTTYDDEALGLHVLCMPYFAGTTLARLLDSLREVSSTDRTGRLLMATLERIGAKSSSGTGPAQHCAPVRHYLSSVSYANAVCFMGACLADALQYAHEQGVIHLDVKPSNILIAADGQPLLLDFHLARRARRREEMSSDGIGGTPAYMSPEQRSAWSALRQRLQPPADVDRRSDIYSLGVVLWEALSGALPDEPGRHPLNKLRAAQVSPGLAGIIGKCLQECPDDRYSSMKDLAKDLRRHLANLPLTGVRNRNLRERWQKWSRRRPSGVAVAIMMFCLILALAAVCVGGAAQLSGQGRLADNALREGRRQLQRGELEAASRTLSQGLALAERLWGNDSLVSALRLEANQVLQAQRVLEAGEARQALRALANQIRSYSTAGPGSTMTAAALRPACLLLWGKRQQLVDKLNRLEKSLLDSHATEDLLELAIFLADMHDDPATTPAQGRGFGVDILHQARSLVGDNLVLDAELGRREPRVDRIRGTPQTAWEHLAIGRAFFKDGNASQAARYFEQAVRLEPHGLWPNFFHGQCCYQQGRFSEAVTAFSICIGAAPDSCGCFHNRSVAFSALEQYGPALADCEQAIKLDPNAVEPHLQRALLRFHLFDLAGACADVWLVAAQACVNSTLPARFEKSHSRAPAFTSSRR